MEITESLENFCGKLTGSSVHLARTYMFEELQAVLDATSTNATKEDFYNAIVNENCLAKDTVKNREVSYTKLKLAYTMNPENKSFILLRRLYDLYPNDFQLTAFLCTYVRDYLLRDATNYLQTFSIGNEITSKMIEPIINELYPQKFTERMVQSLCRNLVGTFYKSGHLEGLKTKKTRAFAKANVSAVVYAAVLAHVQGKRGIYIYDNEFIRAIDCTKEAAFSLLSDADSKGIVKLRSLGDVVEIGFPIAEDLLK